MRHIIKKKGDDQKVKEYGVKLAVSMIQHLYLDADICNFHISTLNLERSTRLILEALHLHTVGKVIYIVVIWKGKKKANVFLNYI